jgi:hypothetical protein
MVSGKSDIVLSSDDDMGANDKDGDYIPERPTRTAPATTMLESTTKLKFLMDQIDAITRKLSTYTRNPAEI